LNFRKDINGLRAIAVLAVVLFHLRPNLLPGGFIGVDIFFVISGYLMTSIIIQGLQQEHFSIRGFYLARARRILPALIVLSITLLVFGWLYMLPVEYKLLGKHIFSSIGFFSNIVYWSEASYFAALADEKWLLHTWSLSVEWQFYIIYPLVISLAYKIFNFKYLKLFILIATVLCFFLAIYFTNRWPTSSYFFLSSRAWEMLVGAIAFLYPISSRHVTTKWIEVLGILLIAAALIFVSSADFWPSYLAMLPVLGTYFIIIASNQKSPVTANVPFQAIGKISYSVYLWHWPIVVLGMSIGYLNESWYAVAGLIISLALGGISYRFVESVNWRIRHVLIGVLFVLTFAAGYFVFSTNGAITSYRSISVSQKAEFASRYDRKNYLGEIEKLYRQECNFFDEKTMTAKNYDIDESCTLRSNADGIFLWGDSHAQALSYGLSSHIPPNMSFYQVTSAGCSPNLNDTSTQKGEFKKACDTSNRYALEKIEALKPSVVVLAQRANHESGNFEELAERLTAYGVKKVVLIGPVPQWLPSLPNAIIKRHWEKGSYIDDRSIDKSILKTNLLLREKFSANKNLLYISLIDNLCVGTNCMAIVTDKYVPLVWDYGHLTPQGSEYVASKIIYPALLK